MPFADLPKVVAVDSEDDRLSEEPWASELGPEQEVPVVQPSWVHKPEPVEGPHERENEGEPQSPPYLGRLVFAEKGPDALVVMLRRIDMP